MEKIPKIIHYCWFGKGEKPEIVKRCIESWKNNLVDYKLIEWNEENFDLNKNSFVREAYRVKKYAFISDYVRVEALYNYGGFYLDTDTEIFKSLDRFLDEESVWGYEEKNYIATSFIGAKKGNSLIKDFLDSYEGKEFLNADGSYNLETNVAVVTEILKGYGLKANGEYQNIEGLGSFYPAEYFSPYDYINCVQNKTINSYAMHHFYKSWLPRSSKVKAMIKKNLVKIIGVKNLEFLRKIKDGK